MTTMASQITSLTIVYSTVYSDADQGKHQSSSSLAFVWGIHRDQWIPRTKGQLRGKCFHLMTSSWTPIIPPWHMALNLMHTYPYSYPYISNQIKKRQTVGAVVTVTWPCMISFCWYRWFFRDLLQHRCPKEEIWWNFLKILYSFYTCQTPFGKISPRY